MDADELLDRLAKAARAVLVALDDDHRPSMAGSGCPSCKALADLAAALGPLPAPTDDACPTCRTSTRAFRALSPAVLNCADDWHRVHGRWLPDGPRGERRWAMNSGGAIDTRRFVAPEAGVYPLETADE